jgi:hypothetical protein
VLSQVHTNVGLALQITELNALLWKKRATHLSILDDVESIENYWNSVCGLLEIKVTVDAFSDAKDLSLIQTQKLAILCVLEKLSDSERNGATFSECRLDHACFHVCLIKNL